MNQAFVVEYKITSLRGSDGNWDELETARRRKQTVMASSVSQATLQVIDSLRHDGYYAIVEKAYRYEA